MTRGLWRVVHASRRRSCRSRDFAAMRRSAKKGVAFRGRSLRFARSTPEPRATRGWLVRSVSALTRARKAVMPRTFFRGAETAPCTFWRFRFIIQF